MKKARCVLLTGAGVSAESGLQTFRDAGGLWEGYRPEEVATPEAFARDPEMVLRFYNERRRRVLEAQPNAAHRAIRELEKRYAVRVITQNVDDLHERAGSKDVLHLHGEILYARSSLDPRWRRNVGAEGIRLGDCCPRGGQLRPDVVWFGEPVPAMETAFREAAGAELFMVVGTSLHVYPAAQLVHAIPPHCRNWLVNPDPAAEVPEGFEHLCERASVAVPQLVERLLRE